VDKAIRAGLKNLSDNFLKEARACGVFLALVRGERIACFLAESVIKQTGTRRLTARETIVQIRQEVATRAIKEIL
jgi:hypothetical protein